jgi:3-phenylpropionate/trans-cinnamate dioxygenase ferredoxin reductase subunit
MQTIVIVGASHAAAQLAASLRPDGWQGEIVMIGDEPYLPYHRPPLSKTFLSKTQQVVDLLIRPAAFYQKNRIEFQQGQVIAIDRVQRRLTLQDKRTVAYDQLALCTGARVRTVSLSGHDLVGVHYLRTIADVRAIQPWVQPKATAVVIGGGYIGLETAASLTKQGMQVVVLEMAARILQRVTAPEVSDFYARIHREQGVTIHTGVTVTAITGEGRAQAVLCADGSVFAADLVIVGVGVVPNVELALDAGLQVDNGIVIDEYCRTSAPDIVALGDCANAFNQIYQRRMRLESVPNANEQAKVASATLCGLQRTSKNLPWFWSDQYDLKLQIAGLSQGYDQIVIRGDVKYGRSFAAFYLQAGRLIAADCVNRPQEFMLSKRLIIAGTMVDPLLLADESIAVQVL